MFLNFQLAKSTLFFCFFCVIFSFISCAQVCVEGLSYKTGKPISIIIENGKISEIKELKKRSSANNQLIIAPGLIDNQINGFKGVTFGFGGGELDLDGVAIATKALWERGVTSYLPTLVTNDFEQLKKDLSILAMAKQDESLLGSIPGFHLEGPYISPHDGYRGAHALKYVKEPNWNEFLELYNSSQRNIITVTVAPEIKGAMEFIRKCTEIGIIVALGHHNGSAEQINLAQENGAKTCTHLGNGCANMINRHDNPLWPQLANDSLMISIICDGFHLRDEEIRVFTKAKGYDKTIITSDVTKFAGLKPGIYKNIVGDDLELTSDGKVQYPAQKVLAGSASAIDKGVGHVMRVTGCTLAQAIQMASTNSAKLYGLNDRGEIEVGKRADLILFTMENSCMEVKQTYVQGNLVYSNIKKNGTK